MEQLSVALVGCGRAGQRHLQALIHCPQVSLAATVDLDAEKAAAAAVAFDAASYDSVKSLLSHQPALDGIILATPSGTHRALAQEALDHKLHVLVERPMALNAEDVRAMIAAAEMQGCVLAVVQSSRLLPTVAQALDRFHEGHLGHVVEGSVSLRWSRPQSYYESQDWRGTRSMEGGVLFNQTVHLLDILMCFSGPIREVFAYAGTLTHEMECEDTAVGVLKGVNGSLFSVNATTSVHESDLEERLVVVGETGSVVLGPSLSQVEFWRVGVDDEDEVKLANNQGAAQPSWQGQLDALLNFHQSIVSGTPPMISGDSVQRVTEVIDALILSASQGHPIVLS